MRALLAAALMIYQAVPVAPPQAGSLEVVARGTQVSVHAQEVPVSRILDRLAQQTGMKVTYEATPPSQAVTATMEGVPVRDAVVRLLEGLGVGYVFRTDRSGQRIETLIVSGAAAGSASGTMTASQPNVMEYPAEVVQDVPEYEPPPEVAQQPQPDIPPPPPGMPAPDLALPGMPAYQGAIPATKPEFPGGVSYPNN